MVEKKSSKIIPVVILSILSLICIVPFILLISASLSSETSLLLDGYGFWPKEFSWAAYDYLFSDGITIIRAYGMTVLVTVIGTGAGLIMTTMLAYAISRRDLPGRNKIAFFVFFAMLFNGGIVPTYIMYVNYFHIKDTIWALIVPNYLVFGFYVIMMRTYFSQNLPESVLESARIDGASEFRIFWKIAMPMSTPILATVGMMMAITYWNDWQNGLYYVNDSKLYTIQLILNKMLQNAEAIKTIATNVSVELPGISIKMAIAVLGALPIMIAFPFFQKYYVKGITIGAVKG